MAAGREPADRGVSLEGRVALLRGVPTFARLPDEVLEELAALLAEERYPASTVVVAEGEAGDRLYLIAEGRAEISAAGKAGPVPLAALGPGEVFGEIALLEPGGRRRATVTATEPLLALSLDAPDFNWVLEAHPEVREGFSEAAEEMLVANFLKQASPFSTLEGERLRRLAGRLERRTVPAGGTIVWQGEPGEECYLLRSGRAEVVVEQEGGAERSLATLDAGSLFGEAALLTDEPRNATVRAIRRDVSPTHSRQSRPSSISARSVCELA